MNVYDFDNTIYDGESGFDFFIFCLKRDIRLATFVFPVIKTLAAYKLCKISSAELQRRADRYMMKFLSYLDDPKDCIKRFWDKNEHKIKDFYMKQKRPDDVIISASLEDFLAEICTRLEIKNLIATTADYDSGKIIKMCHSKNKVELFRKIYTDAVIDEFYTDSKNDMPMMEIAKKAYFVKKNKIVRYK